MTSAEDVAQLIRRIKRAKDLYEILGVDRDTDEKGLTKAYRKLAMRLHPDKCQAEGAEDAFKKIMFWSICAFCVVRQEVSLRTVKCAKC